MKTAFVAGTIAVAAFGTALTAVAVSSVKVAADFETAFTGVRKTVELTESEFGELENRFKTLTTEIPLTFVELSRIGELAGQLGVEGVDNIAIFTKTIADISVTTNLTAEAAATDFARFANIMNMPIEQVDKLGSVIVELGNNLATTEAEIVGMGMRISGAGKALNMSEGEVMAWGAALSSVGVRAEMGGTAISKLMINISSMVATSGASLEEFAKTSDKTGDELIAAFEGSRIKLTKFAKVAEMSADDFATAFKEDASAALQAFFNGLGNLEEKGGNVLTTLKELDITEVRLRDAVLRLSSSTGTLNDALGLQSTAWEENTALVEEAGKRYDTFASQTQMLKNEFTLLSEELGVALIPHLLELFEVIKSDVLPAIKPLIPVFAEFVVNILKGAVEAIPKLIEVFKEVASFIQGTLIPFLKPLIELIGERLKFAFEFLKEVIGDNGPVLMEFIKSIGEIGKTFLVALIPILKAALPILIELGTIVGDSLLQIFETLAKVFVENKDVIIDLMQRLGDFIGQVITKLVPVLDALIPIVMDVGLQLANIAMEVLEALLPALDELIPIFMELLKDVIVPLIPPIMDLIEQILLLSVRFGTSLVPVIKFVVDALKILVEPLTVIINLVSDFLALLSTSPRKGLFDIIGSAVGLPGFEENQKISRNMLQQPEVIHLGRGASTTVINIDGNIYGTDPDEMADAFAGKVLETIRL